MSEVDWLDLQIAFCAGTIYDLARRRSEREEDLKRRRDRERNRRRLPWVAETHGGCLP
jgi:hypothetical protein